VQSIPMACARVDLCLLLLTLVHLLTRVHAAVFTAAEIQAVLDRHNYWRCNVSPAASDMVAVVWDATTEAQAQSFANTCPSGHSGASGYGENLAWGYGDGVAAVDGWDSEKAKITTTSTITFTTGGTWCQGGSWDACGHYTQVVWKGTTMIGCAKPSGTCPQWGDNVYVCNYKPPGNYIGQIIYTVGSGTNGACSGSTPASTGSSSTSSTGSAKASSSGSVAPSSTGVTPLPMISCLNSTYLAHLVIDGCGCEPRNSIVWANTTNPNVTTPYCPPALPVCPGCLCSSTCVNAVALVGTCSNYGAFYTPFRPSVNALKAFTDCPLLNGGVSSAVVSPLGVLLMTLLSFAALL